MPFALAQSDTWDGGGGDDLWGTGNNWADNSSPGVGSGIDLHFAGSTRLTPNNNYTAFDDFGNIFFDSGAGAFTVGGNAIGLHGKIENNSSTAQTLNLTSIAARSGIEIDPTGGDLTLGGTGSIFMDGNNVDVYGGNTLNLNMSVENGSSAGTFRIFQGSTVVFGDSSAWTGQLEIQNGTAEIGAGGDITGSSGIFIGTGADNGTLALGVSGADIDRFLQANSGAGTRTLSSTATSGSTTYSGAIDLEHDLNVVADSGSDLTISGAVNMDDAGSDANLDVSGAEDVTMSGSITATDGNNKINKSGAGTLTLSGDNATSVNNQMQINISGGTVAISSKHNLGDNPTAAYSDKINFSGSGGTLQATETIDLDTGGNQWGMTTASGATGTLLVDDTKTLTVAGVISGDGNMAKTGNGTWVYEGANTYEGDTTISAGTARSENGGTLDDASDVTVASGATWDLNNQSDTVGALSGAGDVTLGTAQLTVNQSEDTTFSGVVSETGSLVKQGVGRLTLSGENTFAGDMFIDEGTVRLENTTDAMDSAFIRIGADPGTDTEATLELGNAAGNVTLDNNLVVRPDADAADNDVNAFVRSTDGDNTISGSLFLDGELSVEATSGSTLALTGTEIQLKSQRLLVTGAGDTTIQAAMSSTDTSGDVLKQGAGTLTLDAANTYSGDTFIDEGVVQIAEGASLNDSTTVEVGSSAAIGQDAQFVISDLNGGTTVNEALQSNTGDGSAGNRLIGGLNTSGVNTFSGNLVHDGVEVSAEAGGTVLLSGVISDLDGSPASLTKVGAGTVQLSGDNSYTATTEINAGILQVLDTGDLSESSVNVNSGGTLMGTGRVSDGGGTTLTVASGGTLSPGNSGVGTLDAGNTVFMPDAGYVFEVNDFSNAEAPPNDGSQGAGTDWDSLAVNGVLDLSNLTTADKFVIDLTSLNGAVPGQAANYSTGHSYILDRVQATSIILPTEPGALNDKFSVNLANFQHSGGSPWIVKVVGASLQLTQQAMIPEPSTGLLLGLGAFLLARFHRSKQRSSITGV